MNTDVIRAAPPREAQAAMSLAREVRAAGGRAYLVGGCVRDALLGRPVTDLDIEVFGIAPERLRALLARHFAVIAVGRAFPVFKLNGLEIDVSVPRRERKHGSGHRGFDVEPDPQLDVHTAALRRDFTINALLYEPLDGALVDPVGGRADLAAGVLRHVSSAFAEDPLRVMRAMQFAARLRFEVCAETVELCRSIEPEGLSRERYFEEWRKLIVAGEEPSRGLRFLRASGWVKYFPELEAMIGCPQEPRWHPEGDVWEHTLHCMDAFARQRAGDPWEDLVVGLAVLCHDMGKPGTTATIDGAIRSYGHETAGVAEAERFLDRITRHRELIDAVLPLVRTHMRPANLRSAGSGPAAIRRLSNEVGRIDRLARVVRADSAGRPPMPPDDGVADWLLEQARALELERGRPQPIIQGRHLIAMGETPGPHFGKILHALYEEQLDGRITDEATGLRRAAELLRVWDDS